MKYLLIVALVLELTGCASTASIFGLESIQSSNGRQDELTKYADEVAEKQATAKQEETEAAIVGAFAALEPFAPGIQGTVRQVFDSKTPVIVPPTPRPEPKEDPSENFLKEYAPEVAAVLGAVGLYAKLRMEDKRAMEKAKADINAERDSKRRERGEALTTEEAIRKGYFDEGKKVTA